MGHCFSSGKSLKYSVHNAASGPNRWRKVLTSEEARTKFELEGSLPRNCEVGLLELRGFLDNPELMKHIAMYGKSRKSFGSFMCWVDIQEFRSIDVTTTNTYQRCKAHHIYQKYLKEGSLLHLTCVSKELVEHVLESLENSKSYEGASISSNSFDLIQQQCLQYIYEDIFLPFRSSTAYHKFSKGMLNQFNRVKPDDFEYIEVLGQGGFGLVVHCKKKSTGKHYALKIQTKMGLLRCFRDTPNRVDNEKQALVACNHMFIVPLDYAFQSPTVVCLAMQLGSWGTLHDAVSLCPNKQMSQERVRFYMAEIVLALAHIHGLGMIYRDLKPQNVLLNADGHVQLVDLGGIIDPGGRVLGLHDESDFMLNGLFAKELGHKSESKASGVAQQQQQSAQRGGGNTTLSGVSVSMMSSCKSGSKVVLNSAEDAFNEDFSSKMGDVSVSHDPGKTPPAAMTTIRARSIMGTDGYMAIEMMLLKIQRGDECKGYTNAVDWWSLGVLVFVLLKGAMPLPHLSQSTLNHIKDELEDNPLFMCGTEVLLDKLQEQEKVKREKSMCAQAVQGAEPVRGHNGGGSFSLPPIYASIYDSTRAIPNVSAETVSFVLQLLDFNESTRLGAKKAGGVVKLKAHPFFTWCISSGEGDSAEKQCPGSEVVKHIQEEEIPAKTITIDADTSLTGRNKLSSNTVAGASNECDASQLPHSLAAEEASVMAHSAPPPESPVATAAQTSTVAKLEITPGKLNPPQTGTEAHSSSEYCWEMFELKHIVPPYIPEPKELNEEVQYESFEEMMHMMDKGQWLQRFPSSYYEGFFRNWDFISPQTLKMELGISTMMEQYDRRYKARQLLGPINESQFYLDAV